MDSLKAEKAQNILIRRLAVVVGISFVFAPIILSRNYDHLTLLLIAGALIAYGMYGRHRYRKSHYLATIFSGLLIVIVWMFIFTKR